MSDKHKKDYFINNNSDDQNTKTIYIPNEVREQYRKQEKPQYREQPPRQEYYRDEPQYREEYREAPRQDYYRGEPQYRDGYRETPRQDYYRGEPQYRDGYREAPRQDYYRDESQYRDGYREAPRQEYYRGEPQYREEYRETQGQNYYRGEQQAPRNERRQVPREEYYSDGQPPRREAPRREPKRQDYYESQHPHKKKPAQKSSQPQPKKKKSKKKKSSFAGSLIKKIIIMRLILFLLLFGMYSCTSLMLINKMNYTPTGSRNRTSGALSRSYVTSILLIGTDGRSLDERGRSDTMILFSMNSHTKEITLTSFMRDCYVEVPGYGWDKLNAAYSYGGAELLMDTIEHNFGVKIDDYVSINFLSFASIVDSVGGIDVDVTDEEAQEINTILQAEVNEIMGDDRMDSLLSGGGKQLHLNGKQALSYARIRYVGNADFERTERQRRVVELVMDKLKSFNPVTMKNIATNVMPDVATNDTTSELYLLSLRAPMLLGYNRQQLQIPVDGSYYGDSTPSGDALIVDFDTNYNTLKDVVFAK